MNFSEYNIHINILRNAGIPSWYCDQKEYFYSAQILTCHGTIASTGFVPLPFICILYILTLINVCRKKEVVPLDSGLSAGLSSLEPEPLLVYHSLEGAKRMGMISTDIRRRTNLPQTQVGSIMKDSSIICFNNTSERIKACVLCLFGAHSSGGLTFFLINVNSHNH